MKTRTILSLAIGAIALLAFSVFGLPTVSQRSRDLVVSSCPEDFERHEVAIDVMLDPLLSDAFDPSILKKWVAASNKVLENSCIPIKRVIGDVLVAKETYTEYLSEDRNSRVRWKLGKDESDKYHFQNSPQKILVFIAPDSDSYPVWGSTWPTMYPHFVLLTEAANGFVLEHELGHLAGANHEMHFHQKVLAKLPFYSKTKNAAYATTCGYKRTIMHSEVDLAKQVAVYSSPLIQYLGKTCGHESNANNRQVLLDYYSKVFPAIEQPFEVSKQSVLAE
jgi:hypothetical protein